MNKIINALEFLAQRRKAIAAFLSGVYGLVILYLALNADGVLSLDDLLQLLAAVIGVIGGTALVHQSVNNPPKEVQS